MKPQTVMKSQEQFLSIDLTQIFTLIYAILKQY